MDILFANAGATWGEEFLKVDEKNGWDRVMDLNVKGVFFTVQKYVNCLPLSLFFLLNLECVWKLGVEADTEIGLHPSSKKPPP